MTTVVHILATVIFASAVAAILYWLMRRRERQLGKECAIIFAVFGSGLISDDWGSTSPHVSYYHPVVDQPMLIRTLLMYGFTSEFKGDIPCGNIYSIWYIDPPDGDSAVKSLAHVCFDQFATRNPVHR